jgi:hypothetical protein
LAFGHFSFTMGFGFGKLEFTEISNMKNFRELRIWQKGMEIAGQVYKLVESFPKEERFGLSLQMTKAAISIPSNIAEGSSRTSEKDYNRFLEIALDQLLNWKRNF